jgi:RIO kinase 1
MAMKLSTKKRPEREDKMLKEEQLKFSERVFDDNTIKTLKYLMNNAVFDSLDYPIQHGKEAAVYRGTKYIKGGKEYVAVKIFKFEGPSFQKRIQYLEGDRRFTSSGNKRELVKIFAKKEFSNLKLCFEAKILCPRPIKQRDNVVVMEFLGEDGVPSELLKDAEIENLEEIFLKILADMKKMHEIRLVHVDLSEYNVIYHKGLPYIIDMGQAVLAHHPQAEHFLLNDLSNIVKYFHNRGVKLNIQKALAYIKGETKNYSI